VSRTIESIHDITEQDVQVAHDYWQLLEGLAGYAGDHEQYKSSFFDANEMEIRATEAQALYQQLSVIYAQAQDQKVDVEDIIDQ